MDKSRRRFMLQSFAAAGLAVTGRVYWVDSEEFVPDLLLDENDNWLVLSVDDRLILAMLTPVILDGVLSKPIAGEQLVNYLKDFDHSLDLLPSLQQKEFKELLSILKSQLGRLVLAGVWQSWNSVSFDTIDELLTDWRNSYLTLLNIAYAGLKELSFAAWYGNPEHWQGLGYAGPPEIAR